MSHTLVAVRARTEGKPSITIKFPGELTREEALTRAAAWVREQEEDARVRAEEAREIWANVARWVVAVWKDNGDIVQPTSELGIGQ